MDNTARVTVDVDGAVVLEESARVTIRNMYVIQLAQLLSQTARTAQLLPDLPQTETHARATDHEISEATAA